MQHESKGDRKSNNVRKAKKVLVYTSMGGQMIVTVLIFVWLGVKFDEKAQNSTQYWTLVMTLLGIALSFFVLLRPFFKRD